MGNLVDHFILRPREGFNYSVRRPVESSDVYHFLPEKYQGLFSHIIKNSSIMYLHCLIDRSRCSAAYGDYPCYQLAWDYLRDRPECKVKFTARYREESLLQVIRTTFYDTILILENTFDWNKDNMFSVVEGDIITEEDWKKQIPEDQQFRDGVITNLVRDLELDSVIIP